MGKFTVEDLWNKNQKVISAKELKNFRCTIIADKQSGGGIGIWKINVIFGMVLEK